MCPLNMHCIQFFLLEGFMYENSETMRLKHKTVLINSSMTSGVEITHPVVHQPLQTGLRGHPSEGHHCASLMVHHSSRELQAKVAEWAQDPE